jgi:hypothetical protein
MEDARMRGSLFAVVFILVFGLGCNHGAGDKRPRLTDPEKNGEKQFETLKALNRLVVENQEAVGAVFPEEAASHPNEKVSKMADLIREGQCKPRGQRPERKLDHSWSAEFEVVSEGCPIRLLENREYNRDTRTWKRSHLFMIRSEAYRELNAVEYMDGSGSLSAKEKNGVVRIKGHFDYRDFRVAGLGNLTYEIKTNQEYPGLNRGGGRVDMILRLSGQWQATASVQWSFPEFQPLYRVNGQNVDEKAFLEMFSAYGLTEIMYLSLDIR